MGYQTDFSLYVEGAEDIICPTCGHAGAIDFEALVVKDLGYDPFEEPCSWYEHEEFMREFSKKYPTVLFELSGVGEDSEDRWCNYYRNGKCHQVMAVISMPPFDETKLE